MKNMKRIAMILMAAVMLMAAGTAQAETLSLNGTVKAGVTIPVYAPIGGTVDAVSVEAGMHVAAGETLFSYLTEKTYASEDGTVTEDEYEGFTDLIQMIDRLVVSAQTLKLWLEKAQATGEVEEDLTSR